ncbi:hypothetical protein D3C72_2315640 [compost metagenome]
MAAIDTPLTGASRWDIMISEGLETSLNPDPCISYIPSSDAEPKRFFTALKIRYT